MAIKKISDLQQFSSVSTGDFALVINTGTRIPKKIAISDLIRIDRDNIFSRYDFSRNSLSGFDQSSISFEVKSVENEFIYNIPETITFSGFSSSTSLLNQSFNLSGIKNDNFCWSGTDFSIQKSGEASHWDIYSGSSVLFKLTGNTTYPQFGPVNPLTANGDATSETGVIVKQTKTQNSPVFFSYYNPPITGFLESTSNLPINNYESAEISYKYQASFYPEANSQDLTFSGVNDVVLTPDQKGSVISVIPNNLSTQTIFELTLSGFSVDGISEYYSGYDGNYNFKQSLAANFELTNKPKITGVLVNDSNTLSNYKPQPTYHSLDINNDGFVSSSDDLILLQRYFNGLTGADLISGISFASGTRSGAAEIESFIQSGLDLNSYDINEDGIVGEDDINFILNFASGLLFSSSGRNGMKEAHLTYNIQKLFDIT